MAEEKGIKETLELLEGLKVLALSSKAVFADGKLDLKDLPVAFDLLSKLGQLSAAVEGVDQVVPELKDLSGDEINAVVAKVLEIVAVVKAA